MITEHFFCLLDNYSFFLSVQTNTITFQTEFQPNLFWTLEKASNLFLPESTSLACID
jgi:hypothetical protein